MESLVKKMDYGKLLGESYAYAKDGLLGNIVTWIMLLILTILPAVPIILIVFFMILAMAAAPDIMLLAGAIGIGVIFAVILMSFYMGYQLKIFRGETPLPPVADYGKLFSDGIRYIVIQFVYMLPALVVFCITVLPSLLLLMQSAIAGEHMVQDNLGIFMGMMVGILLTVIVGFVIGLFAIVGVVRFARTGSMGEAFNFNAILATIGKIGWGTYIIALVIMGVIVTVISVVLSLIPFVGSIIQFIIGPAVSVFSARYICMLYDSAGTP
jgi:hypothetical protein